MDSPRRGLAAPVGARPWTAWPLPAATGCP